MQPYQLIVPMPYDPLLPVLIGFIVVFVAVRVVVRLWDLVGV